MLPVFVLPGLFVAGTNTRVIGICLALEMRSLIDKVFSVNVVAVRSRPSLTSAFNAPGVKCVDQHTNAILCPPQTRGWPDIVHAYDKGCADTMRRFSFYYL